MMKEYTHYNCIKATNKRVQNDARISLAERELARPRVKSVLAEKNKTGIWLSEQMGRNLGTVSRWMTNRSALWDACLSKKMQPSVEQLYDIAKYLDVEVRELLVASKSKE